MIWGKFLGIFAALSALLLLSIGTAWIGGLVLFSSDVEFTKLHAVALVLLVRLALALGMAVVMLAIVLISYKPALGRIPGLDRTFHFVRWKVASQGIGLPARRALFENPYAKTAP